MKSKPDHRRGERWTATARLLRAYRERGDRRAHDRVVQLYQPLVDTFARRYEEAGPSYDELMRAGSIGLVRAIERYVPRRDEEFMGFAMPAILDEIKACIHEQGGTVASPPGDGSAEFDLRDERMQLSKAFRMLDETEHAIVRLRFVEELGSEEAAARLGMSEAELSRRMHAALARIRGEIERLGSGHAPAPEPPANEDAPPQPAKNGTDGHSGRLLLRMPQELHTELANAAEREDVSLNQFITNALAAAVGWQQTGDQKESGRSRPRSPAPGWLPAAILANIVVLAIAAMVAVILLLAAWQDW